MCLDFEDLGSLNSEEFKNIKEIKLTKKLSTKQEESPIKLHKSQFI